MGDISKYFSLKEFTKSTTAKKLGIDNEPDNDSIKNIHLLCANLMDPIREMACGPVVITSGYRSMELNYKVKGASNSSHLYGQAADFRPGYPVDNLQKWLDDMYHLIVDSDLEYHQLIREPTWLHISYHQNINAKKHWRNDGTKS